MRVIQDSEDEDDFDLDDVVPTAAKYGDAPSQHVDPSPPHAAQRGTGSTESLKRTIEAAHRAHLQSPSIASVVPLAQHTSHSDTNDKKEKMTPSEGSACRPPSTNATRRTTPITYGKSKSPVFSLALDERLGDSNAGQTVTTAQKTWGLSRSVQEEWQHHEPMGLFPEPSSTVPNATATQQQLLRQIEGLESDGPKYEPAKSSIPWSEYLKSSVRNTQDQSEAINHTASPLDPQNSPPSNNLESLPPERTPPQVQTPKLSQRTRRGSSVRLKGSPLRNQVLQDQLQVEVSEHPPLADQAMPSKNGQHDTIIVSPRPTEKIQDTNIASRNAKVKKRASSVPSSEDELAAFGLPKEQYKPRPSRSRSSKEAVLEPVDYSMRPERAVRRPRRNKTAGADMTPTLSTPEKVQKICDMGFTKSAAQRVLRQNNGDITAAIDCLVTTDAVDELAPSWSPRMTNNHNGEGAASTLAAGAMPGDTSTRGNQDEEPFVEGAAEEDTKASATHKQITLDNPDPSSTTTPAKDSRVKVVITRSKGGGMSPPEHCSEIAATTSPRYEILETAVRKAKRRKTTLDQPEPRLEEPNTASNETPKGNRRGRGRPRKEIKLVESVLEDQQAQLPKDEGQPVGPSAVLQELRQPPNEHTVDEKTYADDVQETESMQFIQAEKSPSAQSPSPASTLKALSRPFEAEPKAASNSNSPAGKGKVPYRVGLSKRARIAPLLRMVKK